MLEEFVLIAAGYVLVLFAYFKRLVIRGFIFVISQIQLGVLCLVTISSPVKETQAITAELPSAWLNFSPGQGPAVSHSFTVQGHNVHLSHVTWRFLSFVIFHCQRLLTVMTKPHLLPYLCPFLCVTLLGGMTMDVKKKKKEHEHKSNYLICLNIFQT